MQPMLDITHMASATFDRLSIAPLRSWRTLELSEPWQRGI